MTQKSLDDAVVSAESALAAAQKTHADLEARLAGFQAAGQKNQNTVSEVAASAAGEVASGKSVTATLKRMVGVRTTVDPRLLLATENAVRDLRDQADLEVLQCREELQRAQDAQREGAVLGAAAELDQILPDMERKAAHLRELLNGYKGRYAMPSCDLTNLAWVCEESAHRRSKLASRHDARLISDLDHEVLVAFAEGNRHA